MNKQILASKVTSLRKKLIGAYNQANHVIGLLPLKYGLPCKVSYNIRKADDELADIAKVLELVDEIKLEKEQK